MVILKKIDSTLLIFVQDNILVCNLEGGHERNVKIPETPDHNPTKSSKEVLKAENRFITSVCISNGRILVALQNRQLVLYDKGFKVLHNVLTRRAVSKARFTANGNHVLVADKTGDVYLYDFISEPRLILGHLSMLLDVVLSDCGKYIVTSDRDEKIRVSSYPNAYNIVCYCLGHTEFVSNIEMSKDILITGSGDGTIRFWNFLDGRQLYVVNINDYIEDKSIVEAFSQEMDGEKVDISVLPVTQLHVAGSFVVVSVLGYKGMLIFSFKSSAELEVRFLKHLTIESEAISLCLDEKCLFILTKMYLYFYNLNTFEGKRSELYGSFSLNMTSGITALYKRKYDNVQEYLERKKLRLNNK